MFLTRRFELTRGRTGILSIAQVNRQAFSTMKMAGAYRLFTGHRPILKAPLWPSSTTSFLLLHATRLSSRMQVKASGASQCFVYFNGRWSVCDVLVLFISTKLLDCVLNEIKFLYRQAKVKGKSLMTIKLMTLI
jgi:hypothetical protein